MDLFNAKLVTYTIAFGLIISACIGGGLYYFYPQFNWNWFLGITSFFLILESVLIYFVSKKSLGTEKKKMVNLYMLTKVVKVLASLIFIVTYILAVKQDTKVFVIVFILFYLLYLATETLLFVKIEKHIKEKNSSNE